MGWRQRLGVFESALVGVRVEPRGPWRVVVGGELEIAGAPLSLRPYDIDRGLAFRFLHGTASVGSTVIEVEAWSSASTTDALPGALSEGLAGLSFIAEEERARLEAQLLEGPDPQVTFGEDFSLRGGTFTDFGHGFRLRKPARFWEFDTGPRARTAGPGVRLAMRKCESALRGHVEIVPWDGADLHAAHRESLLDEWRLFPSEKELPEPVALELSGLPFLATATTHAATDGAGKSYDAVQVLTALSKGMRIEIAFQTTAPGLAAHAGDIQQMLRSFKLTDRPMRSVEEDRFIDRRIGFELRRPAPDWEGAEFEVPKVIETMASGYEWTQRSNRSITVMALGLDESVDGRAVVDTILEAMAEESTHGPTRTQGTFLGESVEVVEATRKLAKSSSFVVARRGRYFLVTCTGRRWEDLMKVAEKSLVIEE